MECLTRAAETAWEMFRVTFCPGWNIAWFLHENAGLWDSTCNNSVTFSYLLYLNEKER